jgi:hypothetical protein
MFKPLSDFNVIKIFKAETSASTSVSSRLPVILLQKSGHIRYFPTARNIYLDRCVLNSGNNHKKGWLESSQPYKKFFLLLTA